MLHRYEHITWVIFYVHSFQLRVIFELFNVLWALIIGRVAPYNDCESKILVVVIWTFWTSCTGYANAVLLFSRISQVLSWCKFDQFTRWLIRSEFLALSSTRRVCRVLRWFIMGKVLVNLIFTLWQVCVAAKVEDNVIIILLVEDTEIWLIFKSRQVKHTLLRKFIAWKIVHILFEPMRVFIIGLDYASLVNRFFDIVYLGLLGASVLWRCCWVLLSFYKWDIWKRGK